MDNYNNERWICEELDLENTSTEELDDLKLWLFRENVRIEAEKKELLELQETFEKEKTEFETYAAKTKRDLDCQFQKMKKESALFDKKLSILQSAYKQLDIDKKKIEKEKRLYHMNENYQQKSNVIQYVSVHSFFKGVNSSLALKKRYKDLLKIFHPDNLCGDKDTVQMINREYNLLKDNFG